MSLSIDEALALAWTHCAPHRLQSIPFPIGDKSVIDYEIGDRVICIRPQGNKFNRPVPQVGEVYTCINLLTLWELRVELAEFIGHGSATDFRKVPEPKTIKKETHKELIGADS